MAGNRTRNNNIINVAITGGEGTSTSINDKIGAGVSRKAENGSYKGSPRESSKDENESRIGER
eukprot:CAMPEP_0167756012 /NCGR_PEP_ID=MMETSP0110_2-20121227/9139_1 /TAXON_ID=629695 /ORGANISM="Gymnochlora sp., Strain CCMP2014" /LENGTH=62 /DNA_ID=CAMNT_0007642055 /DNA_START=387 /DNA_END=572 /DNA_ORIENTATION=+